MFTRVYKFYSKRWALDALAKKRLKISTLSDLNDPFEFIGPSSSDRNQRFIWHKSAKEVFQERGLISFSKSWSNPVIWSHYAENHRGAALGFDVSSKWLTRVRYRSKRLTMPDLSKASEQSKIHLFEMGQATKYIHWKYEQEYRVFVTLDTPDEGKYFKDFDGDMVLREVVLGPNFEGRSEDIFCAFGSRDIEVVTTRLAFNSYSVVRQRLASQQK
ncbi:DUF2971 domain-containing protein [Ruegeria pomeroyi]|nr:DUF2971 domain-containing protein [Ruegeria pomeroyi]